MKRAILPALIVFTATNVYSHILDDARAGEKEASNDSASASSYISFYKPNYLIFGNREDQVKVQLSIKYKILKEAGFFYGYTQTMFWRFYDASSPFTGINFNPEFFWNYGSMLNYIQLGFYEHNSNGQDGKASRRWDRSYLEFQMSSESFNVGLNVKGFYIWHESNNNKDISDYTGYYEAKVFFKFLDSGIYRMAASEELYIRGGTGGGNCGFDFKKGWVEAGLQFRLLFHSLQHKFFIQVFYGYGESLIAYNQKDYAFRAGVTFN